MRVIDWDIFLQNGLPPNGKPSSMTVGIFDGVHLGHRSLLNCIVSHNSDFVPVVVTFKQNHKPGFKDIRSFDEKLEALESMGIQIVIVVDFTDEFKHTPGTEFLRLLLKHGNIGFIAVGGNFRCGSRLDTDAAAVQKFFASNNIPAEIVPEVCYPSDDPKNPQPISSSRIRAAIAAGDLELAQAMLGYSVGRGFVL